MNVVGKFVLLCCYWVLFMYKLCSRMRGGLLVLLISGCRFMGVVSGLVVDLR